MIPSHDWSTRGARGPGISAAFTVRVYRMNESADEVAQQVLGRLEGAWNDGSGRAFAEPFAEEAEFVDIRGDHHTGRKSIGIGHQMIFNSVYRRSVVKYEPMVVKQLGDDI